MHSVVLTPAGGIVVLHPQTELFVNFPDSVTKLQSRYQCVIWAFMYYVSMY